MFDVISYLIGFAGGEKHVILEDGEEYTFTDPNSDGNIVIQEAE